MALPKKTEAFIRDDYEFTACCGAGLSHDKRFCSKCDKEVSRIYSKGEEYDFADKIWYHSGRTSFIAHPDAHKNKAKEIAFRVHKNQVDKKNYPYMAHVLDIASRVSHLGETHEIVGLLHDAIEDAEPDKLKKEIVEAIETGFSEEVLEAITAMTKNEGEDYFQDYLPRLRKNKIATAVKIADSSHNLSKAHLIEDKSLQDKLRNKYIKALDELGEDGKSLEKPLMYCDGKWKQM